MTTVNVNAETVHKLYQKLLTCIPTYLDSGFVREDKMRKFYGMIDSFEFLLSGILMSKAMEEPTKKSRNRGSVQEGK